MLVCFSSVWILHFNLNVTTHERIPLGDAKSGCSEIVIVPVHLPPALQDQHKESSCCEKVVIKAERGMQTAQAFFNECPNPQ